MVAFKYRPIKYNHSSRRGNSVKFIVIHDTANKSAGADALNHYRYFSRCNRNASAHYFVDDKEIVQIVGDSRAAWHCGDNQGYGRALNGCTNLNSIGVELCINKDGNYDKALFNLIELVKNLRVKFKIPLERVCRHKDVSGKNCPSTFTTDDWVRFKNRLCEPILIKFDLEKDSEGIYIKQEKGSEKMANNEVKTVLVESKYLNVIKSCPDNIYQQFVGGKTLRQLGAYGINGTFFNTRVPNLRGSIWGIAVNRGNILGENADRVNYKGDKKGTFYITDDNECGVKVVNNINELRKEVGKFINFAVSGLSLTPNYNPVSENISADILRHTWHTAIGYKDNEVYLITSKQKMSMASFKGVIERELRLDGAVALDGGGSTEFYYKNVYQGSGRPLASVIGIKEV